MQDNKLIKALVLNAQLGNNSAFEQLYQITIDQIYALILRLNGNPKTAETLVKKTYVNAWLNISKKDEFTSFASWLKKIAVKTVFREKIDNDASIDDEELGPLLSKSPLEKYIQELDFNNKLVFILHDIENFSVEDISKLMGLPDKEIKKILVTTRDHLINLTEE